CLDVLLRFLDGEASSLAICDTDWDAFLNQFASIPPLFRDLAPAFPRPSTGAETAGDPPSLIDTVRRHVSRVRGAGRDPLYLGPRAAHPTRTRLAPRGYARQPTPGRAEGGSADRDAPQGV